MYSFLDFVHIFRMFSFYLLALLLLSVHDVLGKYIEVNTQQVNINYQKNSKLVRG